MQTLPSYLSDLRLSPYRMLPVVLCDKVWCLDIGGYLPKVVFSAETVKTLNLTVEYAFQLEAYI